MRPVRSSCLNPLYVGSRLPQRLARLVSGSEDGLNPLYVGSRLPHTAMKAIFPQEHVLIPCMSGLVYHEFLLTRLDITVCLNPLYVGSRLPR